MSQKPAEYRGSYSHPDAVDPLNYAGTQMLLHSRVARIGPVDVELPERLIGRRLRVRIIVETDP